MSNVHEVSNIHMMGVDDDTYGEMLKVAKKENKSVSDVASEAFKKHLKEKELQESAPQKKLLMEG